jgi:hypothetical protein
MIKSVNHFFHTAEAIKSLLNDTVDLLAQIVNHRRNLANIAGFQHWLESAGAGIRRRLAIVASFRRYCARFQPERLDLVVLPFLAESQSAGLDSIQTSQILTIGPDLAILPVLTGFGRLLAILKIIF